MVGPDAKQSIPRYIRSRINRCYQAKIEIFMRSLSTLEDYAVRPERLLLPCTLTMSRTLRIGVAIAVLLAVATVLIAPSIDMPETTLREHQVTSHSFGEHGAGGLLALCAASVSALVSFNSPRRLLINPQRSDPPRLASARVLRC